MLVDHGSYVGLGQDTHEIPYASAFPRLPTVLFVQDDQGSGTAIFWTSSLLPGQALQTLEATILGRLTTTHLKTVGKASFTVWDTLDVPDVNYHWLALTDDGSGREIVAWKYNGLVPGAPPQTGNDVTRNPWGGYRINIPWTRGARQRAALAHLTPRLDGSGFGTSEGYLVWEGLPVGSAGHLDSGSVNVSSEIQGRFAGALLVLGETAGLRYHQTGGDPYYAWAIAESEDEAALAMRTYDTSTSLPFAIPSGTPAPFTPTAYLRKTFKSGTPNNNCLFWNLANEEITKGGEAASGSLTGIVDPVFGGIKVSASLLGLSDTDSDPGVIALLKRTQ